MNANKKSLGHIFDPSLRLLVPLFQRPYVWKQEANWMPLWESICDVAERRLNNNPRPHFLGAIVLDQMMTKTGDIDTRQIIDGQQRMTTFQAALAAVRDLCREAGDDRYFKAFDKLTTNDVPLSDEPDDVFKIWPTNADRKQFRAVLTDGSPDKVRTTFGLKRKGSTPAPDNLIAHAYLYFYDTIGEWLGPTTEPQFTERLKVLWQSIKDDMQVVVIDLDDDDDAQVIFETLNALGTPLLPADLIKNFLFQAAELKKENIEAIYEKYWKPFDQDSNFWREEVRQGRLKRPRIDLFLQHYLTLMKGDEVPATHLFAEFRDLARKRPTITAKDHLESIHTYGCIFQKFMTGFTADSPEGRFFYRLNELDTTTVFPVLLEVFKRAGDSPSDDVRMVLADLESFLIRRMVCGLTTKNYNVLMRSLIQHLQGKDTFSPKAVRDFLLSQDAESTRWPSDEEFVQAFQNRPLYDALTRARVRILLESLELAMYTGKTEKVTIDSKLTIEHLLPQEWEAHWPLAQGESADLATKRREQLLHTIGNLTLVTDMLNPAMSNGPWKAKKSALSEHCALALNRKLTGVDEWNEAGIESRAKELSELAKKVWPRPQNNDNDVQKIIPLPEAEDYQVRLKAEQQPEPAARQFNPDFTKYDVIINGITCQRLPKRTAIFTVVRHLVSRGHSPEAIAAAVPWKKNSMFRSTGRQVKSEEFIGVQKTEAATGGRPFEERRFFCDEDELLHHNGSTYAFTTQWGHRCVEAIDNLIKAFPDEAMSYRASERSSHQMEEQHQWTENDDIVALYLYRFGPDDLPISVGEIGDRLGMGVRSLRMRIGNFRGIDGQGGLRNAAIQSRKIYEAQAKASKDELRTKVLLILGIP